MGANLVCRLKYLISWKNKRLKVCPSVNGRVDLVDLVAAQVQPFQSLQLEDALRDLNSMLIRCWIMSIDVSLRLLLQPSHIPLVIFKSNSRKCITGFQANFRKKGLKMKFFLHIFIITLVSWFWLRSTSARLTREPRLEGMFPSVRCVFL